MPSKYDEQTRAKAVRLVQDHRGDYASEWEAIKTVSGRLGMNAETLRKWLRQAEVDNGQVEGLTTVSAREIRDLKRRNAELERTVEILRRQRVSSCGRATRNTVDLCVHRRASRSVRSRSDLPRAHRTRLPDRPENLLRLGVSATVETDAVRPRTHGCAGRVLRAGRGRQTPP